MNNNTASPRSIPEPVTVTVRREVALFALLMEKKLAANDHKPHWCYEEKEVLWAKLMAELYELQVELVKPHNDAEKIALEAADLANFAMMLVDNHGGLVCE